MKNLIFVVLLSLVLIVGLSFKRHTQLNTASAELHTINSWALGIPTTDPRSDYYRFRIQYPTKYFATTEEMTVSYISQGGGGRATILLMEGKQVTADPAGTDQVLGINPSIDKCIYVYRDPAEALPGIDGIPNGTNGITLNSQGESKLGDWPMLVRDISVDDGNQLVASKSFEVIVSLPEHINYLFRACNQQNKEDLLTVAKSLEVRASHKF